MTTKPKVAVVEDNEETRQLLVEYLEDEGFEVVQGQRPEEIVGQIAGCSAAIIDVKINAEGISPEEARFYGIQYVLRAKKEGAWSPTTALVFMSNYAFDHPTTRSLLQRVGEHTTVEKPLQMMELRRLRSFLRGDP